MLRTAPADATTALDIAAAAAFIGGIVTVVLTSISPLGAAPLAVVMLATAPRRSTRAVAAWSVVGVVIGLILAVLVALAFRSLAPGQGGPGHD